MKKESLATILSLIAIFISGITICLSHPHTNNLGFDYQGIIVSVLSLLVTILIGWQIYNTILLEKRIKKGVEKAIQIELEEATKLFNLKIIEVYLVSLEGYLHSKDWYKVIITQSTLIDAIIDIKYEYGAKSLVKYTYELIQHISEFDDSEIKEFELYIEHLKKLSAITDSVFDVYIQARKNLDDFYALND